MKGHQKKMMTCFLNWDLMISKIIAKLNANLIVQKKLLQRETWICSSNVRSIIKSTVVNKLQFSIISKIDSLRVKSHLNSYLNFKTNYLLTWMIGLVGSAVIVYAIFVTLFFIVATRASKNLHNSMFSSILSTRIRFFDLNPLGK